MNPLMVPSAEITDPYLRNILIKVMVNIPVLMGLGKLNLESNPISHTEPTGMRFDVIISQPSMDKPMIGLYTYQMDPMKFKDWLVQHEYLCKETPAIIVSSGITMTLVAGGANKWDKSGFHIQNGDQKTYLELIEGPVSFSVHRDIVSQNEWVCHMVETANAAQELKDEGTNDVPVTGKGGDSDDEDVPF